MRSTPTAAGRDDVDDGHDDNDDGVGGGVKDSYDDDYYVF